MSAEGNIITELFKQTRKACDQIGLLLRTADELMLKKGFKSEGNGALEGISYSINSPLQWVPTYAFRFYKISEKRIAFISVLVDDDVVERYYTVNEPYVTAGFLDFGKLDANLNGNYWLAKYFGYLLKDPQVAADGNAHPFKNDGKDPKLKFQDGQVFAVPLVSIKNADDVKNEIVSKLVNLAKNG